MNKINIGIVAHVDAGKTTVTENLLYLGGVINEIGRVDNGNTQTDSMELEKKRGITIKASVVSFNWKNVKINILDTPGHTDFVSEVERALSVLDGAVLVVSSVEGVQAHTLMLFKVLKKLRIPTVIFINKLDRVGSNYEKLIGEMKKVLSPNIIVIQKAYNEGTNEVQIGKPYSDSVMDSIIENLCDMDENFLEAYINGKDINKINLERKIEIKARRGKVYPVLLGAALKGIGIINLINAIIKYLPYSMGEEAKPLSGVVFKIDNTNVKNKKIYVRLFNGKINLRDSIMISHKSNFEKVKRIDTLLDGKVAEAKSVTAGDIGILYGLKDVRIGDVIGEYHKKIKNINLAQPVLKAEIMPVCEKDNVRLYEALSLLLEEDPLLQLEVGELKDEIYINFFGEVQMEIIKTIIEANYGIKVKIADAEIIYKETPEKAGTAITRIWEKGSFFAAGVGLKVEPIERGKGVIYISEITTGYLPKIFQNAIEEAVYDTLKQGLLGWEITDIKVTLNYGAFSSVMSTAADFRNLTPMVLMNAINNAKTELLEPLYEFQLKINKNVCGRAISDLNKFRADFKNPVLSRDDMIIEGLIPVSTSQKYNLEVASYTEGKGMFVTKFHGFRKVPLKLGKTREKYRVDPLNKKLYMMYKLNTIRK